MKTKLLLIFSIFATFLGNAQIVSIPDVNFKNKLLQADTGIQIARNLSGQWFKIDANSDGQIQATEAQQVSALYVNFSNIDNMTGISSFSGLKILSCFSNNITALDVSALSQLQELYCYSNSLSSLVVTGTAMKRMDCFSNPTLTALNLSGLNTLEYLDCQQTAIANINANNLPLLETFYFGTSSLQTLNVQGCTSLTTITSPISGGQLSSVNFSNCTSLTQIFISYAPASVINVSGCTSLDYLRVNDDLSLTSINTSGCNNLTSLVVNATSLGTLNVSGLNNLVYLDCSYNQLTSLNVNGLSNLASISCPGNQLTSLDVSGLTNLSSLSCYSNQLLSLDLSGLSNLTYLMCFSNQLLSLDISECVSIADVNCSNNQLLTVFMKNGKLEGSNESGTQHFNFYNNPILLYICADEGEIEGIQYYVDMWGYNNCQVNSYCTFSPGGVFYDIQGAITLDSNNNGCDGSDPIYGNLKFNVSSGTNTGTVVADTSGNYKLPVSAGLHTVTPVLENPAYFSVFPTSFQVDFPSVASPFTQNICVTPNGSHPDLEITLACIDSPRPGFNVRYILTYKNKGNLAANGQVSLAFQDDVMDLVSADPATTSQGLNTLTWDYVNLQPFESRSIDIILNFNTPMETPPLNGNDLLTFTASISPALTDETPADNEFVLPQTVLNSFDPNDKTCLEGNRISPAMVGKYIHYKIRFENTGNFAAENIVVKDMIDGAMFDVSSLQITKASHNCFARITGNKVEFIFENINLPFDDANNDGYIIFKIKTKPTVVLNDILKNKADIYFDYNFPIQTNETETLVSNALANQQFDKSDLKVYPNPVNDVLHLEGTKEIQKAEIYDLNGRLLQSSQLLDNQINVSQLQPGVYFVKALGNGQTGVVKITKK